MTGKRSQADRAAWVEQGHRALLSRGVGAVTVEGLARELGVTKGSFYWHFGGRDELISAVVQRWSAERTDELIRLADQAADPWESLQILFARVADPAAGEATMYAPAASQHPLVTAALSAVTDARQSYLAGLLERLGHPRQDADDRARVSLMLVVGHQVFAQALPGRPTDDDTRRRLTGLALELAHPAGKASVGLPR